jgi:hypothetical protein
VTIAGVSITAATGGKEVASVVNSTTFTFPCCQQQDRGWRWSPQSPRCP